MTLYNTTFMDESTSFLDLFVGVGASVGNQYLLGNLILGTFFLVFLVLGSYRGDFLKTLVIDAFICGIISVLFWGAGMVALTTVIFPVFIFVIAFILFLFS
jgi:hypothetical protein